MPQRAASRCNLTPPLSPFPPSFEGNPWTYGFALFSLSLLSMLSVARIWALLSDIRKNRLLAERLPGLMVPRTPVPVWSALTLHETKLACLYLTIFIGTFPDTLILLLWGEAGTDTMVTLFLVDRIGDGLTLIPFSVAMMLGAWLQQVVPQKLIANSAQHEVKKPNWQALMPTIKIGALVLILAAGVTMGKASLG